MEQDKPVRRRPPRTLQLPTKTDQAQEGDKTGDSTPTRHARSRNRNSALIEKLQANLALSPTALLPSPKSPGIRLLPPELASNGPTSPISPIPGPERKQDVEAPTSFEKPADGTLLPSINKGRARLSIRRRPPSRRVKRSGEEDNQDDQDDEGPSPSSTTPTEEILTTGDSGLPGPETKTVQNEPGAKSESSVSNTEESKAQLDEGNRPVSQQEQNSSIPDKSSRETSMAAKKDDAARACTEFAEQGGASHPTKPLEGAQEACAKESEADKGSLNLKKDP